MARTRGLLLVLVGLLLSMGLVACQSLQTTTATPGTLHDLEEIVELRETFNAAVGKPRLLLILAPT